MSNRTLEDILYRWCKRPVYIRITFMASMIAGILAHMYMFTNKLPNADDIGHVTAYGQGARVGRWFLEIMGEFTHKMFGNYSMPFLNGMIMIFFLALAACELVEIFELRDAACCIFVGALFASFPSITNTLMFMFTAPFYGIAIFMNVLAAKYIIRGRRKTILGILFFVLSVATYQAYFALCIAVLVAKAIQNAESDAVIKDTIRYGICSVAGMGIYLISVTITRVIFQVQMFSYRDADRMGDMIASQNVLEAVGAAFQAFFSMMTVGYIGLTEYRILRILFMGFVLLALLMIVRKVFRLFKVHQYCNAMWLIILTLIYPVVVFGIYLSGAGKMGVYALMMFSAVMLYILPIVLIQANGFQEFDQIFHRGRGVVCDIAKKAVLCMMICVIFLYCRFANEYYLWMQMDYNQTNSYFTTLVAQIKECEGYREDMDVVLVGDTICDSTITGTDHFQDITMGDGSGYLIYVYSYQDFIRYYCGFNQINDSLAETVQDWPEVKAMPAYPNEGAIKKVNDVIVVKISDAE